MKAEQIKASGGMSRERYSAASKFGFVESQKDRKKYLSNGIDD